MSSITLPSNFNYQILIAHAASSLDVLLSNSSYSSIFILVDENTEKHCLPHIVGIPALNSAKIIRVQSGEKNKSWESSSQIFEHLIEGGADRQSILVNLGGGMIGDIGGFCASIYMRGIRFVQVPTSLLSMVDASVGGKLGIDFNSYKNLLGAISNPMEVIIDPAFLNTLPDIELLSGWAEMMKHGLIASKQHWNQLINSESIQSAAIKDLIMQSLAIKALIVEEDPLEQGRRRLLNAGHTIGHAIESYYLARDQPLPHGLAIAAGLRVEAYIASEMLHLKTQNRDEIWRAIDKFFPLIQLHLDMLDELLKYVGRDKKMDAGKLRFVFLEDIGRASFDQLLDMESLRKLLIMYIQQQ
ncbi:MAG: 3-dehydroquinate synthase [Saprospiraceae bacterium]